MDTPIISNVESIDLGRYRQWRFVLSVANSAATATASVTRRDGALAVEAFGETRHAAVPPDGVLGWDDVLPTVLATLDAMRQGEAYPAFAQRLGWIPATPETVDVAIIAQDGSETQSLGVATVALLALLADTTVREIRIRRPAETALAA